MTDMSQFLGSHTGLVLFIAIFVEQIGVPLPAAPLLVAAGALAADGQSNPLISLGVTVAACVLADLIWFYLGRRGGEGFLRYLGRLPLCDASSFERTERLFTKYGMSAVVAAKFIFGIGFLMPPLAGALRVATGKFFRFDALGSLLYGVFYLQLGFLFRNEVNGILQLLSEFGVRLMIVAAVLILIWIAYKWVQRRKSTQRITERAPQGADSIPAT